MCGVLRSLSWRGCRIDAENSAIKAAITRTTDKARLAYGRSATIVPRQFVMIATTNDPAYLKDRGGNRRFWPMRVDPGVLDKSEKTLLKNLDLLWGEAAVAEAAGEEHASAPRVVGGRREGPEPACCRRSGRRVVTRAAFHGTRRGSAQRGDRTRVQRDRT